MHYDCMLVKSNILGYFELLAFKQSKATSAPNTCSYMGEHGVQDFRAVGAEALNFDPNDPTAGKPLTLPVILPHELEAVRLPSSAQPPAAETK